MTQLEVTLEDALVAMLESEPDEEIDITSLPDDLQALVLSAEITVHEAVVVMKARAEQAVAAFEQGQLKQYLAARDAAAGPSEDFLAGFRQGWSTSAALAAATIQQLTEALVEARVHADEAG